MAYLIKLAMTIMALLALTTAVARADDPLKVIRLNHRQAESLLPMLNSMYGDKARLSGMGLKLFVKAPPALIEEIARFAAQLDVPARMLRIAIKGAGQGAHSGHQLGVSGNAQLGRHVNVGVRSPQNPFGGGILVGNGVQNGHIQVNETAGQTRSLGERYVLVEEGSPATIEGFGSSQVVARVQGASVTVQLVNAERSPSAASAQTTVGGRLGDWISVGGVSQSSELSDSGLAHRHGARAQDTSNLMIKVDLAR